jgi:hypothetical protein
VAGAACFLVAILAEPRGNCCDVFGRFLGAVLACDTVAGTARFLGSTVGETGGKGCDLAERCLMSVELDVPLTVSSRVPGPVPLVRGLMITGCSGWPLRKRIPELRALDADGGGGDGGTT